MTVPFDRYRASLRDTDTEADRLRKLLQSYGQSGLASFRKASPRAVFAKIFSVADDERGHAGDDGGESDDDETAASKQHFVSTLADLLVEGSEGAFTRPSALYYLLHSPRGAALVHRLHNKRQKKERTHMTTTRAEELSAIAKQYGIAAIAKKVVDDGPGGISEHEMTKLITEAAQRAWPELRPAAAFSKMYCGDELLRRAVNACKTFDVQPPQLRVAPSQVGGAAAQDVDDATDALAQLEALAAALRRQYPELTREKAFAKVYTDPANVELVKRERFENRPRAAV
jgi:hypothetical protein